MNKPDTFTGVYRTRDGSVVDCKGFFGTVLETAGKFPVGTEFTFNLSGNVTHYENIELRMLVPINSSSCELDLMQRLSGKDTYERGKKVSG